jgi:hypothetical protein
MKIYVVRYALMAKYTVVYTEEIEGGFSGRCLELSGAISQGETLGERVLPKSCCKWFSKGRG